MPPAWDACASDGQEANRLFRGRNRACEQEWPHLKLGVARAFCVASTACLKVVRWLVLLLCSFCLARAGTPAAGSWSAPADGPVPVTIFSRAQTGVGANSIGVLHDPRGRLFVFSDRLSVFDGVMWTTHSLPGGTAIRSLHWDKDRRLWTGAINQLGYYAETARGWEFHSLLDQLPESERDFQDVWACTVVGRTTFFVCHNRVLAWDGGKFTTWPFATANRLFPVRIGDELWFNHSETGFHRLTEQGPVKMLEPTALPPRSPFWAERDGADLLLAGSAGTHRTGSLARLSDDALTDFLRKNFVTQGVRLPGGEVALATFGGLAIVSPDLRRLLRVLALPDGLPDQRICGVTLDESDNLWLVTESRHVVRIDARNTATRLALPKTDVPHGAALSLARDNDTLHLLTENGVFHADLRFPMPAWSAVPLPPSRYTKVLPTPHGNLYAVFAELRLQEGDSLRPILRQPGITFIDVQLSRRDPATLYLLQNYALTALHRQPDGNYQAESLHTLRFPANSLVVDERDNVWVNSPHNVVVHFDQRTRQLTEFVLPTAASTGSHGTRIVTHGGKVYLFSGAEVFVTDTERSPLRPLPRLPDGAAIIRAALSPDGQRLYALIERPGRDREVGLCSLALDAGPGVWREWDLPALSQATAPGVFLCDPVDGRLWIGSDEGVLRVRPEGLREAPPPSPLHLRVSGAGPEAILSYGRHRLVIAVDSPDLGRRGRFILQTRLLSRSGQADWTNAGPEGLFEFSNLADGTHTFEVRAIDPQGRASDTAAYRFTVRPPPWRSPLALGGYALAALAGLWTLLRLRERTIRRRNEELERTVIQRTTELRKANAAKDEFLASISHEIRNPLNGVVGLATSIDARAFDAGTRLKFGHLQHCATHLASLLEDILDFSKLESGGLALDPQPFNLRDTIASIAAITADQSARTGRRLDIQVSPQVPAWVHGDAARIRQTVINLVINAMKYSDRGEVQLTVWARQTQPEICLLTFAVSDEGPGIAPGELAQLFTRFTRGAAAKRNRQSGSGIGLAICKALAEKMGGRIWAESELGSGSTFYCELPLPVAVPPAAAELRPSLTGRALVVDDEDYNRIACASLLEPLGFVVVSASDGRAALAQAERERFAFIFLDYDMPGLSGPATARALRDSPAAGHPFIIGTTAFVTPDKHDECRRAGMDAVITKPLTAEKLRHALAALDAAVSSVPAAAPGAPAAGPAADPLEALTALARRKGIAPADEIRDFATALAGEAQEMTQALAARDSAWASRSAHKLVGRCAYLGAGTHETSAREVEAAVALGHWERAASLWQQLAEQLDELVRELRAGT